MRKRGFTLIELCYVIAIIATLAAILFPVFARARESARRTACASNLSQIGAALNVYAQSYDGHYPKKNNQLGALYSCVGNYDVFYCPSDSTERPWDVQSDAGAGADAFAQPAPRKLTYSSYVYRGGLCNDDRADIPIAGERQAWHGDLVNVLHLGGYVRTVSGEAYKPPAPIPPKPAPVLPAPAPGAPGAPPRTAPRTPSPTPSAPPPGP